MFLICSMAHQHLSPLYTTIISEKRYRFRKKTLYEREVVKKQKFLFAGLSFHTHTTGGLAIIV
jgi:hypothetical protein